MGTEGWRKSEGLEVDGGSGCTTMWSVLNGIILNT